MLLVVLLLPLLRLAKLLAVLSKISVRRLFVRPGAPSKNPANVARVVGIAARVIRVLFLALGT